MQIIDDKEIGIVGRIGPDMAVVKYKDAIQTVVTMGTDFDQAAKNAVILAKDLVAKFPTDPNIHKHVTDGVVTLAKSGVAAAAKVGEDILEKIHMPSMDMAVAPR